MESPLKDYPFGRRGFASMESGRVRQIASEGGKAAQTQGKAYNWTSDSARAAGKKGGQQCQRVRRDKIRAHNARIQALIARAVHEEVRAELRACLKREPNLANG